MRWTGRQAGRRTGAYCVTLNQYQSQVPAITLLYINNDSFKSLDTFLLIYVWPNLSYTLQLEEQMVV